jgi:hypothetical protein
MRTNPPSVDPWAELGEREHLVQFYDDSHSLIETLDGFIGGGLRANSAGIVIATREHIDAWISSWPQAASTWQQSGRAANTSRSRPPSTPADSRQRLAATGPVPDKVGSLIDRAHARWARCARSGEMVGLLWEGGATGRSAAARKACGTSLPRLKRSHSCVATTSASCAIAIASSSAGSVPCTDKSHSTTVSRSHR